MATPSLQDVLCAIPTFAAQVEAMTVLSPGVASSPANVKALLKYLVERGEYEPRWDDHRRRVGVRFKTRRGKPGTIKVKMCVTQFGLNHNMQNLVTGTFPCTEEGLLKALGFAKDILRRLRGHGLCSCSLGNVLTCYFKLPGMPRCGRCQMSAAIGA